MELNTTQYNRLKDHCIMVSKLRYCSDVHHIYYYNIIFGEKISLKRESTKFGTSTRNIWVNVHQISLTHRQRYEPDLNSDDTKFFNISLYANAKLSNHLRKSYACMNDD